MKTIYQFVRTLLLTFLVVGCATTAPINTDDLLAYHDAVESLSDGSESALAYEREWTYRNYMTSLTEGRSANPADVILVFPDGADDPFAWALSDAPVYMAILDTESRLAQLNGLFSDYTLLLIDLAGGRAEDAARIMNLSESLNRNSISAAQALGATVESKHVAFFSAAATAAAKAYLNGKRRESLQTVLRENQSAVDAFAQLGADAASLSAVGIKTEYQNDTERWIDRVVKAAPAKRDKLVMEQLALNEHAIAQLDALRMIHDSYLLLAQKHAELANTVATGASVNLRRLIEDGQQLRDLYRDLREAGRAQIGEGVK